MEEADLALAETLEASVAAGQAQECLPAVTMEEGGLAAHLVLEEQAHMV